MKKLVAILLVLAMVFVMAACGGDPTPTQDNSTQPSQNEPDSNKGNEQRPTSTEPAHTEPAPTEPAPTEPAPTEPAPTEPAPTEPTTPTNNEISFTEVVVVDNDQCVIKITSVEDDRVFGFTLKAFFENKSSDKTYMFSVESAAINGVQCDPFFATEVAAGKKSNESIIFYGDELKDYGVGDYTDIELTFRVYDTNDWLAEDVARETIHIYPYGQDKATNFVRESKPTDNVLIDNEYVTVIVTGYEEDSIWGYTVNLFLVNKTDVTVMFSVDEASVNGFMADPFYAESVIAGKCAFSSITWYTTTLEENGITDVEELEFRLRVYDYDNWLTEDFANEYITLIPCEANDNQGGEPDSGTTDTNETLFSEVVVVDNDQCTIKITGVEDDSVWGFTLKAFLENKSSDKTYMFSVESATINGVQCDPFFATEVAAGKKSNESITFLGDELKENGVGDYTDIELTFRVYDTNDWLAEDVARETIHIYPYGQDKATNFVRESKSTDNVLIDNEYVTVIVTGCEEDSIWGYTVNLFLVNKTDVTVMFSVDEASVNGFMADPFYAESVIAGKCAFSSITWYSTTLEENGITDVEELEFRLRVYDYDNWLTEDFANEYITLEG